MAKKSSKPTNLTGALDIVRFRTPVSKSGHIQYLELKLTWNPPKDCTDQDCYITYNKGKPPKKKTDLSSSVKSRSYQIDAEKYYPTKTKKLTAITFGINAKQKNKKRSSYNKKTIHILPPGVPERQTPQVDSSHDACVFAWGQNSNDDDVEKRKNLYFTFLDDYEWETTLSNSSSTPTDAQWKSGKQEEVTIYNTTSGVPVPHVGHGNLTESYIKIYENQETIAKSLYRWVRVRARGPGGHSYWVYMYYKYGTSADVSIVPDSAVITAKTPDKTTGKQDITIDPKGRSNFDVICQYAIVAPRIINAVEEDGTTMVPHIHLPIDFDRWVPYKTITGRTVTAVNASFEAPALEDDQVLFIRNVINQNGQSVPAETLLLKTDYTLPTPTIGVSAIEPETHRATISINAPKSSLDGVYTAIYFRTSTLPSRIIAMADNQTQSLTVQAPNWGAEVPEFGVQSFVGSFTPASLNETEYSILSTEMSSNISWDEGQVPKRPTNVKLTRIREGVMQVKFDWVWTDANQAEISWAMDPDAWISTDGPQTYVLSNTHSGVWNISGLSAGTWYVKVRLMRASDDVVTYSLYSDRAEMSMSAAPDTPSLHISGGNPSSVTSTYAGVDETLTAFWSYKSNDGTNQREAIFAEATMVDSSWTFEEIPDKTVESATHFNFTPAEMGWESDSTHHLSVRLRSMSDVLSDNWSAPVTVVVASKPSIELSGIGDVNDSIVDNNGVYELVKLPLEFTIDGGDTSWTSTVTIERAQSTDPRRPDDSAETRFAGEAVYVNTFTNTEDSTPVSIALDDPYLIGKFDQGTPYILTVISKDSYGQDSEPVRIEFTVNWEHKALMPTCIVKFDHTHNVAFLTPRAPEGAIINEDGPSDVCDIYRYSVDGLTCIAEDLAFDTNGTDDPMYVDQYPTLGLFGGYRIVFKTLYGDYKTSDDDFAWIDIGPYDSEEDVVSNNGDYIRKFATIIDFGGNTLTINGNISISDSWKKDFQLTRYLGGSMIGDWNPGVERSGSQTAVIPVREEVESIPMLRELAEYSGQCRIRTPEGSNYFANIEVKDDRESMWVNKISKVNLTISRVDAEDDEVITYDKWETELAE